MPMMTIQELLDKYDREKNTAKAEADQLIWECEHCEQKFKTRRGRSVHIARDAYCKGRESEQRRQKKSPR